MIRTIGTALIVATGLVAQQVVNLKVGDTRIKISNFSQLHFDPKDQKHFHTIGKLAIVDSPEKGLTAKGRILDFLWAQTDPKTTIARHWLIDGSANVVVDTERSFKASSQNATAAGKEPPLTPNEFSVFQADSDTISYVGDEKKGTIDFPNPWTFRDTSRGSLEKKVTDKKDSPTVKVTYDQVFDATGSKGQVVLVADKTGSISQLYSGYLDGPVHFKLVRHEKTEGDPAIVTRTYVGKADHMDLDLTTDPGTVTVTGHVTIDGDDDGVISNMVVDRLVISVSQKLEPLSFDMGAGSVKAKSKDGSD